MNQRLAMNLGWLAAYLLIMALVLAGVFYGRRQAIQIYASPEAQAEWNAWREDATQMAAGPGPVKRRAPQSAEPPALVLMRDYFAICLVGALGLTTVLFGTTMIFIRGALASGSQFVDRSRPPRN